jgi:PAS domain S-box-containing protein
LPGSLELGPADDRKIACRVDGSVLRPRTDAMPALLLLRLTPRLRTPSQFSVLNERIDALTREIARRKRVETELRDQREWLQVTLTSIGDAVIAADTDGRVVLLNPAAGKLTGWSSAEALHRPLPEVFRAVDAHTRQPVADPVARVIAEGNVVGLASDTVLLSRDGSEWPIDDSAAPIRNARGELLGVILIFREISERKRVEHVLAAGRHRLEVLADMSKALAERGFDLQDLFDLITRAVATLIGDACALRLLSEDGRWLHAVSVRHVDAQAQALLSRLASAPLPAMEGISGEVIRSRRAVLVPLVTRETLRDSYAAASHDYFEQFPIHSLMAAPLVVQGVLIGTLAASRHGQGPAYSAEDQLLLQEIADRAALAISNARQYQRAQEERQRFEAVLKQMPAGVAIAEAPSGRLILDNEQVSHLFRQPRVPLDDLEAYRQFVGLHPDGRPYEPEEWPLVRSVTTGEAVTGEEVEIERGDGTRAVIRINSAPIRDAEGRIRAGVAIFEDITDEKHARDVLVEEARRKDEFLAMLSHELRNPLAPVTSALEILRMQGSDEATRSRMVEMLGRQIRYMVRLVDDLLDVSRITRGKIDLRLEVLDAAELVQRAAATVEPLIRSRSHTLSVAAEAGVCVRGDAVRLEQVLVNLVTNAAKFTRPGGRIDLELHAEAEQAVFRVRDTGTGIHPELLPRIFDLFVQDERSLDRTLGGLGIGLTIVKRLVEMHGGTIQASSPGLEHGSEFVVRLPVATSAALPDRVVRAPDAEVSAAGARVLVVDDNVDSANSLAEVLRLWGYRALSVHDGRAALEAVRSYRPRFVLLDIGLPGMDGYQVAAQLQQERDGAGLCLIALTGYGQEQDRTRALESGFDQHLTKPVDLAALRRLLDWRIGLGQSEE